MGRALPRGRQPRTRARRGRGRAAVLRTGPGGVRRVVRARRAVHGAGVVYGPGRAPRDGRPGVGRGVRVCGGPVCGPSRLGRLGGTPACAVSGMMRAMGRCAVKRCLKVKSEELVFTRRLSLLATVYDFPLF